MTIRPLPPVPGDARVARGHARHAAPERARCGATPVTVSGTPSGAARNAAPGAAARTAAGTTPRATNRATSCAGCRSWPAAAASVLLLAFTAATPAAQAGASPAAGAPTASTAPPAASPPRRVVTDSIAQRVQACTGCHGAEGRAGNEGYFPRIAGKPAGYLYNQLLNFREGRRRNARMTYLVDPLSDAYLHEMAAYFASLDLPYPPPAKTDTDAAQRARGEALVRHGDPARGVPACASCHGRALMGREPATPGLLALPRDYLIAQLGRWQIGLRRTAEPDCMAQIAKKLTPQDINALANWLPAQPVPPGAKPEPEPMLGAKPGPVPGAQPAPLPGRPTVPGPQPEPLPGAQTEPPATPPEPPPALRCAGVPERRP